MAKRFNLTLFVCLLSLLAASVAWAEDAGYLLKVGGRVLIDGEPAAQGDRFSDQATINTQARSFALLKFTDQQSVFLRANSRLEVANYSYQPERPQESSSVIELLKGGMRAISGLIGKAAPENVSYETPVATIGIRGSEFRVSQTDNDLIFIEFIDGLFTATPALGDNATTEAGDFFALKTDGSLVSSGEEARALSEELNAFEGLDASKMGTGLHGNLNSWGQWSLPIRTDSSTSPARLADTAVTEDPAIAEDDRPSSIIRNGTPDIPQDIQVDESPGLDIDDGGLADVDDGDFADIGGEGEIRGQVVWQDDADLDLHMTAPGGGHVAFYNRTLNLDSDTQATLDQDNTGSIIDVEPNERVENIIVTGPNIPDGDYQFWVFNFSPNSEGGATSSTLRLTGDGGTTERSFNPEPLHDNEVSDTFVVNRSPEGASYLVLPPPSDPQPRNSGNLTTEEAGDVVR